MLPETFMGVSIAQDEIGWVNIMEGRVLSSWRDIQEEHLAEKKYRRAALRWDTGVVIEMLKMFHSQLK